MRISADFLQKNACRPADFGFRRLQHFAENAENPAKIAEITFLSAKCQIELHQGLFLVYNHLRGPGSPQGENYYVKVCHTLRRVFA